MPFPNAHGTPGQSLDGRQTKVLSERALTLRQWNQQRYRLGRQQLPCSGPCALPRNGKRLGDQDAPPRSRCLKMLSDESATAASQILARDKAHPGLEAASRLVYRSLRRGDHTLPRDLASNSALSISW